MKADTSDVVRDRCKNNFGLCAYWATKGMCTERVVYMLANCPLACRVCDRIEAFHRCTGKRHPLESPSFKAGSILNVFQDIKGGKWEEYEPQFVSEPDTDTDGSEKDPYVVRFDNFLTEVESSWLIEIGNEIGWTPSTVDETGFYSEGQNTPRRSSLSAKCEPDMRCEDDPIYHAVLERISAITGTSFHNYEAGELVKYGPRESYGVHHDYHLHDEWRPAGPRVLTILLILSDVDEGGAAGFPDLDWLFVKPKRGQALMWSNVMSDDPTKVDNRMRHEGLPVVKGHNFVMYIWVHLYNWRKAHARECA